MLFFNEKVLIVLHSIIRNPTESRFCLFRLEGALGNFKFLDLESQNAKKRGRITDPKKVSGGEGGGW